MCGITGFIKIEQSSSPEELTAVVERMSETLKHRGPDDHGSWVDDQDCVAFGFRRLSIVDLSEHGKQPMFSESGRYVVVFNGEIYNFLELRSQLEREGVRFRGHSDTEVLLSVIEKFGVQPALERFNGMFAFALWDRQTRTLHLARDKFGEKPLYYGWMGHTFLFGSELKALRAHPSFRGEIDRNALALYFRYDYIPAPHSIYKNIYKLPPGTWTSLRVRGKKQTLSPIPYWSAHSVVQASLAHPFEGSEEEAAEHLDLLLKDAVKLRMIADVPLGAFLSGGIDSSTIVALMQAQCSQPVKTFSIGFLESDYNEAVDAAAVAHHLRTEHTELYVRPQEARAVIPMLPQLYDEPFADSSQIPTFLISQLARRHVTVSLSGDGGDELFGGYNRYFWGRNLWRTGGWMPKGFRRILASLLKSVSPERWDRVLNSMAPLMPRLFKQRNAGDKLHKLAGIMAVSCPEELYQKLLSCWDDPPLRDLPKDGFQPVSSGASGLKDLTNLMMFCDSTNYLPDDILTKVDRASMGTSLEARVPFLDPRVYEFAWRLPLSMKIRNGSGKWLLRQVLDRYVPREIIERPKMGFGVPIEDWIRGPLRSWTESLLEDRVLESNGLDSNAIRAKWKEHLSGRRNWQYHLWAVLMFQAWSKSS